MKKLNWEKVKHLAMISIFYNNYCLDSELCRATDEILHNIHVPDEAHFSEEKVTSLGVLCCFALFFV